MFLPNSSKKRKEGRKTGRKNGKGVKGWNEKSIKEKSAELSNVVNITKFLIIFINLSVLVWVLETEYVGMNVKGMEKIEVKNATKTPVGLTNGRVRYTQL